MKKLLFIFSIIILFSCNKEKGNGGKTPDPEPVPDCAVYGKVTGDDGNALEGVVVSDGHYCVKTNGSGEYALPSNLTDVEFIFVSTPSGYSAPVKDALPVFFKPMKDLTRDSDGKYRNVDFRLNRVSNPQRFTLFLSGDPQPRASTAGYDKLGYHAFDCVKDMCRDFKETAAKYNWPVYGMVLGDVCHNDVSLYPTYKKDMSGNGFPSYHVLGNHDHDLNIAGDKASAATFESYFGPVNYSFNLGDIHFVVLDNMMVREGKRESNSGEDLGDGLRDDIWEWLNRDLALVPDGATLMICAHSPMFMCMGETMRKRGAISFDGKTVNNHYGDVDNAIKRFGKVYAWAGHTHNSYNYVNINDEKVESHTLVRVTGELWTNEYESGGTPRGYTVLDYDEGEISWKFHPIKYQSGGHQMSKQPSYDCREWDFVDGVAKMKRDGATLDEKYQMHVIAPGTYSEDIGKNTLYVNIFLWDEKWKKPKLTYRGQTYTMSRKTTSGKSLFYDYSSYSISDWYKTNNTTLKGNDGYSASKTDCATMFYTSNLTTLPAGQNTATVKVTDRFGNEYSSTITW